MIKDVSSHKAIVVLLLLCGLFFGRNIPTSHAHSLLPITSDHTTPATISDSGSDSDDPTIVTPVIIGIALIVVFSLHAIVAVEHRREDAAAEAEHDTTADWPV